MWDAYGRANGLILTDNQKLRFEMDAQKASILGPQGSLPPELSDRQLAEMNLKREWVNARKALVYYEQNTSVTNFQFFNASTLAEASREMIEARKLLWEANRSYASAQTAQAIRHFTEANAKWRLALQKYPRFHYGERSDTVQEFTAEIELRLVKLLMDERKVPAAKAALQAIAGQVLDESADRELAIALAEVEATDRIAAEILKTSYPAAKPESIHSTGEYAWLKQFTSERKDIRWIIAGMREQIKMKEGLMRRTSAPRPAPLSGEGQ